MSDTRINRGIFDLLCLKALLLIIAASLLVSCGAEQRGASEKNGSASKNETTLANTGQKDPPPVSYVETTDKDGKKVWIAKVGPSTYRIPDAYMGTATATGIWLHMHWPSGRPASEIPQSEWSGKDQLNVKIKPESVGTLRTAEFDREQLQRQYPKHTLRAYPKIPGLLQIFNESGNPTFGFLTNRDDVRMPNGESYFFNVPLDKPDGIVRTFVGLPDGNSLIVDFRVKHVADWHLIFPEVLRRIEAMREK